MQQYSDTVDLIESQTLSYKWPQTGICVNICTDPVVCVIMMQCKLGKVYVRHTHGSVDSAKLLDALPKILSPCFLTHIEP